MTFDEWWDSNISIETPHTFRGWEASCRQAWNAGAATAFEQCAVICDVMANNGHDGGWSIEAEIRARSNG